LYKLFAPTVLVELFIVEAVIVLFVNASVVSLPTIVVVEVGNVRVPVFVTVAPVKTRAFLAITVENDEDILIMVLKNNVRSNNNQGDRIKERWMSY